MTREGTTDPLEGTSYKSLKPLGEGAMGIVVEAQHRKLKRTVCVKIMRSGYLRLPMHANKDDERYVRQVLDRMRLEAESLAALDGHPNLLAIHDYGETPTGEPFLVTERLHGRTLREHVDLHGPRPVDEAVEIMCQALAGLAHAHANGIVHRDVKPANLFVCDTTPMSTGWIRVLDFGIAKVVAAGERTPRPLSVATEEGIVIGTPRFVSPEQALGQPANVPADLYAIACVGYCLLAGRGPFDHHKTALELTRAHAMEKPTPVGELVSRPIPHALERALLRALEKKPKDRFADADEMIRALRSAIQPAQDTVELRTLEMSPAPSPPVSRWKLGTEILDVPRRGGTELLPLPSQQDGKRSRATAHDESADATVPARKRNRNALGFFAAVLCATILLVAIVGWLAVRLFAGP